MPLQITKNRFYRFIADIAHIWAEFWVMKYGARCLKVSDEQGSWYLPFDGKRYRDFVINVKVEVGASTLWGESQTVATLDNLLSHEIIDPVQYVSRLPHGVLPQQQSLLREMRERADGSASNEAEAAPTTAESTNMADDRMTDELVRQILSGEV